MNLVHPEALLLLPALLVAGTLILSLFQWKARSLRLFAQGSVLTSLSSSSSDTKQRVKALLLLASLAASMIALARPFYGAPQPAPPPGHGDVMVALDVSLSMAAQDVAPSRLTAAKEQILTLIDHLQGDRIGLVVFAGEAALRFPTTHDYNAAKLLVRAVELDSAPTPGSALAGGVRTAVQALRQSQSSIRAVLLLSDGEDHGSQIQTAAQIAQQEGIPVYTVGFGTATGGAIPLSDGAPKRDQSGQIVQTRLEVAPLRLLAESTKGAYARAVTGRELQHAYESIRLAGARPDVALPGIPTNDLTSVFVFLVFSLLTAEYLLTERRSLKPRIPLSLTTLLPLTLLITVACGVEQSSVFNLNQAGSRFYQQSRFIQALEAFHQAQVQRPDLPELSINAGAALYKTGEFERALRENQRALTTGKAELGKRIHFNMGNAYYQLEQYQEAYQAYKRALLEDPSDLDAKVNLELALRKLQERASQQNRGSSSDETEAGQPDGSQQPPPNQGQGQTSPGNTRPGSQNNTGSDPASELRQTLRQAGAEITLEEALRILDALRDQEDELQSRYQQPGPQQNRGNRPAKDW